MGVPTIASHGQELDRILKDREDVYLCSSSEDWTEAMEMLVVSAEERERIGKNAYQRIKASYGTNRLEEAVLEAFLDI